MAHPRVHLHLLAASARAQVVDADAQRHAAALGHRHQCRARYDIHQRGCAAQGTPVSPSEFPVVCLQQWPTAGTERTDFAVLQ